MLSETCVQTRSSQPGQLPLWSDSNVSWSPEQINASQHMPNFDQQTSLGSNISPIDFVVEQAPPHPRQSFSLLSFEHERQTASPSDYSSSTIDLQVWRLLSHPAARCLFLPELYPTLQSRATTTSQDLYQTVSNLPRTLLLPAGNLDIYESLEYRQVIRNTAFYRDFSKARDSGVTPKRTFAVVLPLAVTNNDQQQNPETWATVVLLIRPGSSLVRAYYGFSEKSPLLPPGSEVSPEYIQSAHGADLSGILYTLFPRKCRVSTRAMCLFPVEKKQDSGISCALTVLHMTHWPALQIHFPRPRPPEGLSYSQLYEMLRNDLSRHMNSFEGSSSLAAFISSNHTLPCSIFPDPVSFNESKVYCGTKPAQPRVDCTVKQLEARLRHIQRSRMRFEHKRARLTAQLSPQGLNEAEALRIRIQKFDDRIESNNRKEEAVRWALQHAQDNAKSGSVGSGQRLAARRRNHRSSHRDKATRELEKLIGKMNIG